MERAAPRNLTRVGMLDVCAFLESWDSWITGLATPPFGGQGLASNTTARDFTDFTVPAEGEVRFYLVRTQDTCGPGTFGTTSRGSTRTGAECP